MDVPPATVMTTVLDQNADVKRRKGENHKAAAALLSGYLFAAHREVINANFRSSSQAFESSLVRRARQSYSEAKRHGLRMYYQWDTFCLASSIAHQPS